MKNILIMGYGEVGKGIGGLYEDNNDYNVFVYDIKNVVTPDYFDAYTEIREEDTIDILHICIPYIQNFAEESIKLMLKFKPKLTIINSTVPIGMTRDIYKTADMPIAHSPVMGKRPNLTEGIKTFTKIIGSPLREFASSAAEHFNELGVTTIVYKQSEDSEAAKLFDTTYYGWNIFYMKYLHKFCEEHKLDFDSIYTETNKIYNEGYTKLGNPEYVRPVLKHMPGSVGGHCIKPNYKILCNYGFYPAVLEKIMDNDEDLVEDAI
jgi:UDP-N-acetyl-D-mannosaminuronate dehydrogenase